MNGKRSGYALVAIAASSWGTWPFILRYADRISPSAAPLKGAIVMMMITLGAIPFLLRDRVKRRASAKEWLAVGWLGIADAANVVLFFYAYALTSVGVAVTTHYLTPLFVALAAPLVLGEKARARTYVSVTVAFVGLLLLLRPWRTDAAPGNLTGALCGAGSAAFYASNVLVNKRLVGAFSGSELMFFHGIVGTVLLWLLVPSGALASTDPGALGVIALAGLGPGALSGLLFVWGLRRIPASHASTLTLLEPLVAVALAAMILGEKQGFVALVGAALILTGAVLVVSKRPDDAPG